ncbi:oxidoreductase [Viridothelium virens]|uniref:Oxidoreductase n=1 Tax=Viridothelium virens TaxID=1048519 RepID=A0A6A6HAV5_VIRVR|nr:oxidoreductase [Viridothelium virens]
MASAKLFDAAPPFPEDVSPAQIARISLSKLRAGDKTEARACFEASRTLGFFMLDLNNDDIGEKTIRGVESVYSIAQGVHDLPMAEKEEYCVEPPEKKFGYKAAGFMKTETGQPDRIEFFDIEQDDIFDNVPRRPYPQFLSECWDDLRSYLNIIQQILTILLSTLSGELGVPPSMFRDLQSTTERSGTRIRLIRNPPSLTDEDKRTALVPHTDFGTVTFLANVIGGLQILPPNEDAHNDSSWKYLRPQPGCLLVNFGDAMPEWTGGVLRSNMHRVSYAPGRQAEVPRYSVVVLVRPGRTVKMGRRVGGRIPTLEDDQREGSVREGEIEMAGLTADEWERKKSVNLIRGVVLPHSSGGRELKPMIEA